ncbi:MAG: type II secretion system F family protein [Alphaproteobacteria bacterium]
MSTYHYRAVTSAGRVVEGEMEAGSQSAVISRLHDLGHVPIHAEEIARGTLASWLTRDLFAGRAVSRKRVGLVTRELATLLGAGLPLDRSFEILVELAEKENVRTLLARVLDGVRGGASLADAMAAQGGTFPPFYVSMVRAGESGGALESVLARLADFLEKSQATLESVRSALIYPAILLGMAGLSLVVLLTVVVPEFKPLFEDAGEALPAATQAIIVVGEVLGRYGWLIALGVIGLVWALRRQLADPAFRFRWDGLMLGLPLFGDLVRKIQVARFSRTLGTLLENGVTLLSALAIVKETLGNAVMARAVEGLAAGLKEGQGLAGPLAVAGVFPNLAVQLVRVGEETGQLEDMLIKMADIYDRESQRTIQRLLSLLVPVLTIGLGFLIAGIIASVLVAFLSVNELAF